MNVPSSRQTREKKPRAATRPQAKVATTTATHTTQPVSPCDDLHVRIAQRAYELHAERGYPYGSALDDWLEAEREILSQIPPA